MSADETVNAGVGPKLFLVGRMAFLILLCTWFLRRSGERWADLGLRRPRRWWVVPLLVVGGFVVLVVLTGWIRNVLVPAIGAPPPQPSGFGGIQGDLAEYLFYATFTSWGTAAFGEELLARGFILDRIAKVIGSPGTPARLAAIVLQAAIFGAFHIYQGSNALVATMIGLLFGLMWLVGGRNLWACIILHGLVDFISDTEYYFNGP